MLYAHHGLFKIAIITHRILGVSPCEPPLAKHMFIIMCGVQAIIKLKFSYKSIAELHLVV